VYMEDVKVMSNVDVYKEVGQRKALIKKTVAVVADGALTISFRRLLSNPMISGIQIYPLPPQTNSGATDTRMNTWMDLNEDESYTARHECSFVQAGNKFYLFGGRENPKQLEIYDFTSNTWSVGASPPEPFNHFQATQYEGLIWVVGSFRNNAFPLEPPAEEVHVYDPAHNVWMLGPSISRPRGAGGLVVYQQKFYLVNGNTNGHAGGFVSWLDEYNPQTGEWKQLSDAPHARDHFHAAIVGDKLYAAGGRRTHRSNWFNDTIPQVDVYDFTQGKWLVSDDGLPDDLPIPRAGTTTAVWNDQVLVIGGESSLQSEAHNQVHALDPATGNWLELASLNYGRHGMQAIASGGGIYVAAGSPKRGGGNQKHMEVFGEASASGEKSVAGSITSQSVEIGAGSEGVVTIRHDGTGNQGVFVTAMNLSGQDSSDFEIVGGPSPPFLISQGGTVDITVRNNGSSNKAWLDITHSGDEWLSIPLDGQGSVSSSTPPPPTDDLSIKSLVLVDASTNRDIYPVYLCENCIDSTRKVTIRAELQDGVVDVERVRLTLTSPFLLIRQTEGQAPFTLLGDQNGVYNGRTLEPGEYTATAQAFSNSGESGPLKTETFTVIT